MKPVERYLTVFEAAALMGRTPNAVRQLIKKAKLEIKRADRRVVVPESAIRKFYEKVKQ